MRRTGSVTALVGALTLAAPMTAGAAAPASSLDHQTTAAPVMAIARCYGRFIAWRDELSSAMLETGAPPSPDAPARFDRVESAFAALVLRDRQLKLRLQPAFHETDFPPDIRDAFRTGLEEAGQRFAAAPYKTERTGILAAAGQSSISRMSAVENQSDAAFADLGVPCDRFAKSLDWVKVLQASSPATNTKVVVEASPKSPAKAKSKPRAAPRADHKPASARHAGKSPHAEAKPAKAKKSR